MQYEMTYHPIAEFPKLGWVACLEFDRSQLTVFHGPAVECNHDWMVEGVWDGAFTAGDFHRSENFFGSGIRIQGDRVYFVPSSALVDRLLYCVDERRMFVSNSLILLLASTGANLDNEHNYKKESHAILKGVKRYDREFKVSHPSISRFFQIYHENIVVEHGKISFQSRSKVHHIQSFEEYCTLMDKTLHRLKDNYESRARKMKLDTFATVSSGYDSPAVSSLAKTIGVTKCFTSKRAKSAMPSWISKGMTLDDGTPIARKLGLQVIYLDPRADVLTGLSPDELYFYSIDPSGSEIIFQSMAAHIENSCSGAVVFTGYHGDKVWDANVESKYLNDEIVRGDVSGLLLSEIRLKAGFIHVAVPFIVARCLDSIAKISRSGEMAAWRLNNSYDRPIPRRILETAGIDRSLFGIRKKAVMNETASFPRNPELRKLFVKHLKKDRRISPLRLYTSLAANKFLYNLARSYRYIRYLTRSKTLSLPPLFAQNLKTNRYIFGIEKKLSHLRFFWSVNILTKRAAEVLNRSLGEEWRSRFFDVSPGAAGEPLTEGQREKRLGA